MTWQSMVMFSVIFAAVNNLISRGCEAISNWRRGRELDCMLRRLEGLDQKLERVACNAKGVKRVK